MAEPGEPTLAQVAAHAGVSPPTVRRWIRKGLVPGYEGRWTPAAVAYVRVVARLRARGHTLEEIKRASDNGQLAVGPLENLLAGSEGRYTVREVARETGLEEALIERLFAAMGLGAAAAELLSEEDMEIMKYVAAVLEAGLPAVAFLQLARVYGQAIAQIAEAEVRLIHLYVHEPLMREGMPNVEIAEEMEGLARELIPFVVPLLRYTHDRLLGHFVEQDVIGHMESDLAESSSEEGRVRVAIVFADLAGYARLTVERGDGEALAAVERFVEAVENTLPPDARVIKTLGDEVMVVGPDAGSLVRWAVALRAATPAGDPPPRIGMHYGDALYRDGDYYGREINQAARVVARAGGGEVLVTRPIVGGGVESRRRALRANRRGRPEGLLRADRAVPGGDQGRVGRAVDAERSGEVERVRAAVRAGGLLDGERPLVAMLSGGRDSVCLLDVAVALRGAGAVRALHVNYGLREDADEDERHCACLCVELGVELSVVRAPPAPGAAQPGPDRGNLQAWARELRYGAAERLARELDGGGGGGEGARTGALIAAGHTASDQVETILYRLAASPGRRALLGMPAAEGRLVRPLLAISRERTAAYCRGRGLGWREDRSNEDERFARARVREAARAGAARDPPGGRVERAAHGAAVARGGRAARCARRAGAAGRVVDRAGAPGRAPAGARTAGRDRPGRAGGGQVRAAGGRARGRAARARRAGRPSRAAPRRLRGRGDRRRRAEHAPPGAGRELRAARGAAGRRLDCCRWRVR